MKKYENQIESLLLDKQKREIEDRYDMVWMN